MSKKYKLNYIFVGVVLCTILSCATREKMIYLQPQTDSGNIDNLESVYEAYAPKLQTDDLLSITVLSSDPLTVAPFNLKSTDLSTNLQTSVNPSILTSYLIDENGDINFPVIGKVHLAGMKRSEAINFLQDKIRNYVTDAAVNITIINFKFTVLGEVTHPSTFTIDKEQFTIFQALGMAGDLTINGVRKNVLVLREKEDNNVEFIRVDLTNPNVVNSPGYYLNQNDVIYVEPNGAQISSSNFGRNTSVIISVAGLIITVISVLTR